MVESIGLLEGMCTNQPTFRLDVCNYFSFGADMLASLLESVDWLVGWFGNFSWVVSGLTNSQQCNILASYLARAWRCPLLSA